MTHFVNCLGIGGTERQLVEMLRTLVEARIDVDLCCLQKVGDFLPDVRTLGVEPEEFHLRGSLLQPNTGIQVARLAMHLRRTRSHLLHCHDYYSNLVGTAAARLAGIPCIVSRRDQGAWRGPWRSRALSIVTRSATQVLCNSSSTRERIEREEDVPRTRTALVPNGMNLARFDADAARGLAGPVPAPLEGQPVFVMVGNMKHAVKGHALFLSAAAHLVRTRPDAVFLLAGDGGLRATLEQRSRALGLSNRVHFLGRRTDIPALLSRAHVAISASESEGLSNAILEAMAARLPVVATSVGGNPELVIDGRTGFLVPPRDAIALSERMGLLANERSLAIRMGESARRHVEGNFSSERMVDALLGCYASLLPPRNGLRRAA